MRKRVRWSEISNTISLEFLAGILVGALLAMLPMNMPVYICLSILLAATVAHMAWRIVGMITLSNSWRGVRTAVSVTVLIVILAWGFSVRFAEAQAVIVDEHHPKLPPPPQGTGAVSIGRDVHGNICTSGSTCIFPMQPPPPKAAKLHKSASRESPPNAIEACFNALRHQSDQAASPQVRVIMQKQDLLEKFWREYQTLPVSHDAKLRDPKTIAYLNQRLSETGEDWRITPENQDILFGNVFEGGDFRGHGTGVIITGGGGNIFDNSPVNGTSVGADINNSNSNLFINSPVTGGAGSQTESRQPLPMPMECRGIIDAPSPQ